MAKVSDEKNGRRVLCRAIEVDWEFARLQVGMGTPKYRVADRLNISIRTLNNGIRRGRRP